MHIDFYGMDINIIYGQGRMAIIGSSVDPNEFNMAHEFLRGGDRCLVAGGGRGSVATWIAAMLRPENVVVYEAIPDLWRMMKDNIRIDGKELPHLYLGALGTENKDKGMVVPKLYTGNSPQSLITTESMFVPEVDTNDIIRQYRINSLSLDIEGAEYSIIPHLDLTPLRMISMELHGTEEKAQQMKLYIERNGFTTVFWIQHDGEFPLQHLCVVRT